VRPNLVTFSNHALNQVRIIIDVGPVLPIDEESRGNAIASEFIEDLTSVDVRAIIKGQGDCAGDCALSMITP
jgi:hypothetical protein